jgi:hypothetical protein
MSSILTRVTDGFINGAGTITASISSPNVVGVGTAFSTEIVAGHALYTSADVYIGTVLTIGSATTITLTSNAAVPISGGTFKVVSIGTTSKHSPLSNAEIDQNFVNLNNDKVGVNDAVSSNTAGKIVRRNASGGFTAGPITVDTVTTSGVTYPTTNATQAVMEAGTDTTTRYMTAQNVKQAIEYIGYQGVGSITGDLNGFENRTTSSLTFNQGTRTLTLTPIGTCVVWSKGKKITIGSALTYTFANASFNQFIVFNPTSQVLEAKSTPDFFNDITVAHIYWDSINARSVVVGDERHASSRDTQWHYSKHNEVGTVWKSGGDLTYIVNDSTNVGLSLTSPIIIADEDLEHSITHNSSPSGYFQQILTGSATLPTIYLNNGDYVTTTPNTLPWISGNSTARYNSISGGMGSLSDAGEGKFVNYWIIATNDMINPVKALMGRVSHNDLMSAFEERFLSYGMPFAEFVPLYQVVLQTSAAYTGNSARVKISAVREITSHHTVTTDLNGLSHSGFSDLTKDDHLQYMHISTARTITAAHTFNGVQTFVNGIKINSKPVVNLDGSNKQYVDQQSLIMSLMLS